MTNKNISKAEVLEALRSCKKEFEDQYGVTDIGIFGSVARGEEKTGSDVDVFLKTKTPNPFNIVHIKEELEGKLHQHVDIVRLRDKMNPFLRSRIEEDAVYV